MFRNNNIFKELELEQNTYDNNYLEAQNLLQLTQQILDESMQALLSKSTDPKQNTFSSNMFQNSKNTTANPSSDSGISKPNNNK